MTTVGAEQTEALAERLGSACEGGELVVLTGELGSGKTCFVRGLARGLGCDPSAVRSPSFTLLHAYAGDGKTSTAAEFALRRCGLEEALGGGGVAALEWGECFVTALPPDRLEVELTHLSPESRRLRLSPVGPGAERWLARAGLPPGQP